MANEKKAANSARPSSLDKPVPGAETQSNLDKFMASQGASSDITPQDTAEETYTPLDLSNGPEAPAEPSTAGKVLDAAGRTLDYPGGFTRAGLAEVAGLATGNGSIVTEKDIAAAARGQGPNSAEYLRRLGVPEGGALKFGDVKITSRGAAGLALDIATDPLTALAKMIKVAPYIGKAANLPGKVSEALGEAVYKSAVSGAENKLTRQGLIEAGTSPIGDALIQSGAPVGGAAKLAEQVNDMSSVMGKMRQGLYDKATELGVSIDTAYPLKRAEAMLDRMRRNPNLRAAAGELQGMMDAFKAEGRVGVDIISEWKSQLYASLPKSAYGAHGKLTGEAKMFKGALAADFRDAIVQAGNKAEKGLGDAINALNEKWGMLLDAQKPMTAEAVKGGGRLGDMVDGAILAVGGLKAAAVKKGFDLAVSPTAKTAVGRALMEAGKRDLANRIVRQSVATAARPSPLQPTDEEQ